MTRLDDYNEFKARKGPIKPSLTEWLSIISGVLLIAFAFWVATSDMDWSKVVTFAEPLEGIE